jgi:hypothetical protein
LVREAVALVDDAELSCGPRSASSSAPRVGDSPPFARPATPAGLPVLTPSRASAGSACSAEQGGAIRRPRAVLSNTLSGSAAIGSVGRA